MRYEVCDTLRHGSQNYRLKLLKMMQINIAVSNCNLEFRYLNYIICVINIAQISNIILKKCS